MVLKNPYMVKQAIGKTAGQTLELEADTGEAFLVKNIMIGGHDATFTDITIDKAMVGRWRTLKALGNHLPFPINRGKHSHDLQLAWTTEATTVDGSYDLVDGNGITHEQFIAGDGGANATLEELLHFETFVQPEKTLMKFLGDRGLFTGYPVAEGQKLIVKPAVTAEYIGDVVIEYERYEPGDITPEMENGSEALDYLFVNYGDVGSALTTTGDYLINVVNSPSEFPDFPVGKDVPAKTEIDLLGMLASDAMDWDDATHISYTTYLKLIRERTTLFDDDRNGILLYGDPAAGAAVKTYYGYGNSPIGNYSTIDSKKPFMFPAPITFMAGEELNAYLTCAIVTNAASIAQAGSEIGFIEKVRRVA